MKSLDTTDAVAIRSGAQATVPRPEWFVFLGVAVSEDVDLHPNTPAQVLKQLQQERFAAPIHRTDGNYGVVYGVDGENHEAAEQSSFAVADWVRRTIGATHFLRHEVVLNTRLADEPLADVIDIDALELNLLR